MKLVHTLKRYSIVYFMALIFILLGTFTGAITSILYRETLIQKIPVLLMQEYIGINLFGIILNLTCITILTITSIFGIGFFLYMIYFFINGLIIGLIETLFWLQFGFSGFIFGILFISISYIIFLILLVMLFGKTFQLFKYIIGSKFFKYDNNYQILLKIKNIFKLILLIILNDIIIYFLSPHMFSIFHFLLK